MTVSCSVKGILLCYPVPQPKLFVQLNPLQVNFDGLTILWLHSFVRGLEKTLDFFINPPAAPTDSSAGATLHPAWPPKAQLEVHLEALMPRVCLVQQDLRSRQSHW